MDNLVFQIIKENHEFNINNFNEIQNGYLILYSDWSGESILNVLKTYYYLNNLKYLGGYYLLNIDNVKIDLIKNLLGFQSHGWGEIIEIKDFKISQIFKGKNSYKLFKESFTVASTNQ